MRVVALSVERGCAMFRKLVLVAVLLLVFPVAAACAARPAGRVVAPRPHSALVHRPPAGPARVYSGRYYRPYAGRYYGTPYRTYYGPYYRGSYWNRGYYGPWGYYYYPIPYGTGYSTYYVPYDYPVYVPYDYPVYVPYPTPVPSPDEAPGTVPPGSGLNES